jgi:hypothetical protein
MIICNNGLIYFVEIAYNFSNTLLIIHPGVEAPAVTRTYLESLKSLSRSSSSVSI